MNTRYKCLYQTHFNMQKLIELLTEIRNLLLKEKEIFTLEEASIYSGYEVSYLRKLCSQRKIKHCKSPGGRQISIMRKDLIDFLTACPMDTIWDLDQQAKSYPILKPR